MAVNEPHAALNGLRVLELASLYSAPLAGSIMADFGADVIKAEPPEGDVFRDTPMWPVVSRGKRSIELDPRSGEGQDAVRELAGHVDVLLHNVPPRVLDKWGLGHDALLRANPDLIIVSVTCFGSTGPYRDRPGSGTLAEAFGGLTHLTGEPDGPPMLPSVALGDGVNALSAVIGTLLALRAREQGAARGQVVDLAMYEPVLQMVSQAAAAHRVGQPSPRRTGSKLANPVSIRNVFATADGHWVAISCSTPRHQRELLEVVTGESGPALTLDQADERTAQWIAGRSIAAVMDELTERRIPGVPVNDMATLAADPQVRARHSVLAAEDRTSVAPVPRLTATPGRIGPVSSAVGQHTEEIREQLLGARSQGGSR